MNMIILKKTSLCKKMQYLSDDDDESWGINIYKKKKTIDDGRKYGSNKEKEIALVIYLKP